MALEAMTFQQEFPGYGNKDFHNLVGVNWGCDYDLVENEDQGSSFDDNPNWNVPPQMVQHFEQWDPNSYSETNFPCTIVPEQLLQQDITTATMRPRRRRSKTKKNKEEIENQRMTHITVERNRRKQMNEYLSVLRQLMPESYAQKGDQASIIGGAINYVKELEQKLHICSGEKPSSPFSEFFSFPQYSTGMSTKNQTDDMNQKAAADIEVTIVDNHANIKIRSNKRLKQLSRLVCGLENLRLTILHLNVITVAQTVLYSLSVKVENDCMVISVDEIAAAVNQMLGKIQEEST